MSANKKGYWALIALFSLVYINLFFTSEISQHVYSCNTDTECYEECVQAGESNCE